VIYPAELPALPEWLTATDSHCHLDEERYAGDRKGVIERAQAAGVRRMITIGASDGLRTNYAAIEVAESNPGIYATVGIHPHDARLATPESFDELSRLADPPRVVGIGETGLDYFYDNSPRNVQQEVFRRFIALAREKRLPLIIHLRDAYADAVDILQEENADEVGGVIHCFSGDRAVARQLLDLNFDLSFSGVITYKKTDELRAVAREVPSDHFLIETDAPFLAPVPHRGKRNEPAFVLFTAACIAHLRNTSLEDVVTLSTANTTRRFCLSPP